MTMTKEQVMQRLYDCCRWGKPTMVAELLLEHRDKVDLLYYENAFLFALVMSHDTPDKCVKLLNLLIDFYKETKLDPLPKDSLEYKMAYHILRINLDTAYNRNDEFKEVYEIVKPYLIEEVESEDEQDLSGFDDDPNCIQRSFSEPCLTHTEQKGLLHSSSESLISMPSSYETDTHEAREGLGQGGTVNGDF